MTMNAEVYKRIRKNIMKNLPKDSVTFIMSGEELRKSADAVYPFHANRNFVYATGIEEPLAILVFDRRDDSEHLFLRDVDPFMEKWIGHYMRKEEAYAISEIENIHYMEDFETFVEEVKANVKTIGLDFDHDQEGSTYYASGKTMQGFFAGKRMKNVFDVFVKARMVKHPEEVEKIREAIALTDIAIQGMLQEMYPGRNEKEMEARFIFEGAKRHGSEMFDTIVAGGKNAVTLHYISNNMPLNDGEMVLVDLGIARDHYGADISRTYPINGKFTARQKEVYNEVLHTMREITAAVKPGVSLVDLNNLSKESLGNACLRLGLINDIEDVDQYYYHSIGHSLGLDTHDVWLDREAKLEPGNVITNEPGLYIAEEGIGVRLETDLLVTEDGCEDLGKDIMIDADEVEAFLAARLSK